MHKPHSAWLQVLTVAALLLLAGGARVEGQATTGAIQGTVKDSTGAVVPGITVTATHTETNFSRHAVSDSRGEYAIEFLPLGSYRVEATQTGFQTFVQTGIVVGVSRRARVDPVLSVGTTETVTVSADAPLVDTTHATLGRTVDEDEVLNLPLVDRDVYTLLDLVPGVDSTETTNVFGSPGQETLVNGSANASAGAVNYNLDGGSNASGLRNTGNPIPNPDAIEEFRVSTNSYSAEYGRFAGGVVDVVTKSGTNDLHGSLFEFFRNEKLNADRWSPVPTNVEKDPLKRNNFGGSLGGPIRKDRTFFFVSYSGLRERTTEFDNSAVVPTELERRGDFSQSARKPNDPRTGQPFPNNQIPLSRFDPAALRILNDYIPRANLPGNFHETQTEEPVDKDEVLLKLTHALSASHQLTGSYFLVWGKEVEAQAGNLPWVQREFTYRQHNLNLSDTWTVGPSTINQLTATYVRNFGGRLNTPEISLGDLGSKYQIQGPPSLPQVQVSGYFNLNSAIAGPVAGSNFYQVRDVLSFNKGRHSIRVGGEGSLDKIIHDTTLNNYGTFTFDSTKTGNALADFFIGVPRRFNQDAPVTKTDNTWYLGLFIQDDWRIHPRLTLNLGLRYDLQTPYVDPQDRKITFVPGRRSTVVPSALPGMLFPGDEGIGRGIVPADKNNFAPRVGVAWDVKGDGKTAVRGALGVFYGTTSGNMWNFTADGQPFSIRQQFNDPFSFSDPYRNLPGGIAPFPYEYDPASPRFVFPAAINGFSLDFRMAYTYQMNLAVQRQLGKSASATVAYVGAMGHNLPFDRDVNYPVYGPGATTGNVNARRPYLPGQLGRTLIIESILGNDYHGLQVMAEKRIGRLFQAQGSYVFSKSLEDGRLQDDARAGAQNMNNLAAERGRTDFDRRHVVKMSAIARTDYFDDARRFLHAVLDGWTVSTIFIWRSGDPLTITDSRDNNLDGQTNDRASLVGDPNLSHDRPESELIEEWFNRAAFVPSAPGQDGNAGRNIIDGPGRTTLDMGLFRDFGLSRGMKLQFRLEATNAFNIVNYMDPGTNLNASGTFGRIREARPMRQVQLGLRLSF